MRRLTPFEKEIAEKIYFVETGNYTSIYELIKYKLDRRIGFRFHRFDNEEDNLIEAYYKRKFPLNNLPPDWVPNFEEENLDKQKASAEFKLLFDTLNLIYLLDKNDYIYISKSYEVEKARYIPPAFKLKFSEFEYTLGFLRPLSGLDFNTLTSTRIQPSAALEIFVNNEFRTEEQKQNDVNRKVGLGTLVAAVIGLLLTGVFSGLTYWDTLKRHEIEDARYLKEHPVIKNPIDKKKGQ